MCPSRARHRRFQIAKEETTQPAVSFEQLVAFLRDRRSYPGEGPVDFRETHISMVFLTSASAYKLMKPVEYDFLDFSTREGRYVDCWREVVLNRRLAKEVYLGVVPITQSDGALRFGGTGSCVDWVVHMRRLPDEVTLQARVEEGLADTHDVDCLLDVLCPFFQSPLSALDLQADTALNTWRQNVEENLAGMADVAASVGFSDAEVAGLRSSQLQFLSLNEALFRQRVHEGRVRNGHGDLRAEHVYLGEPVVVVDCIEFNDRFRHVDSLDDVCFLASDLERLNRADLADYLVSAYRRRLRDAAPDALVSFYKSYRDGVRAKVAGLRAAQESAAERQADCDRALKHLHRALRTMRDWHTPFLIVMCGLSGSGKSTIATRLSARLGAQLLASDRVRKSLFGLAPLERCSDPALYGPQAHVKTYAALRESAGKLLGERATVVLDATFLRRGDRASVTELAGQLSVPILFVECRCPVEASRDRIRNRQAAGSDPSDAGVAVLESQRERYESPSEIPADRFLPVDTEHPPEELVGQIVSRLALL